MRKQQQDSCQVPVARDAGSGIGLTVHAAPDSQWRKLSWWQQPETRRLTFTELQKLAYIVATRQYH